MTSKIIPKILPLREEATLVCGVGLGVTFTNRCGVNVGRGVNVRIGVDVGRGVAIVAGLGAIAGLTGALGAIRGALLVVMVLLASAATEKNGSKRVNKRLM